MTVREYMKEDPEKYIKLGAQKGSGFIFCGQCKDFASFEKVYNKKELKRLQRLLKEIEDSLTGFRKKSEERLLRRVKDFANDQLDGTKKAEFVKFRNIEDFIKRVRESESAEYHRLTKQKEIVSMRIYFFTDVGERELMAFNDSITENSKGIRDEIVLFHGYEMGDYWDLDEIEGKSDEEKHNTD